MTGQATTLAELTVPVRGDLTPLRNDLAAARRELEAFSKSMNTAGGAGGSSSASAAMSKLQRDLSAANDNARKLSVSFNQMGGAAKGSFGTALNGAAQLNASMTSATMDFSAFTKSVDGAVSELSKFTGAANQAGAAANNLGGGLDHTIPKVKPQLDQLPPVLDQTAKMSKNLAFQQRNLSLQLGDTAQSLALGMPFYQVLLQQGPQIAQIWGPNEGGVGRAFSETGKMIGGLILKFPLLSTGLVVAAGAILNMRSELKAAGHEAITFGDVLNGLWKTIFDGASSALDPLKPYLSDLWDWITDKTKQIGNTILISFMDVYNDLKFLFGNFGNIIAKGVLSAVNAVIDGIETMINAAIKGINTLITSLNGLLSKIPGYDASADSISTIGEVKMNRVESPALDKAIQDALAERNKNREAILNADPMGDFYDAWKENSVEAMNERLSKKKKKTKAEKEDPYEKIIRDSKQFIEQQNLEADAIGKTEEQVAALRYEQEMLNKAADAHIKLTEQQKEEIHGLAEQMAAAEQRAKDLKAAYDFGKETFKGFFTDLKDGLMEGKSLWESFGTAAANAIQKIADKLLDSALDGIFDSLWNGGGSGGGILGSVLGWITGGHASGTQYSSGGWKMVGEKGPELMKVPGGAQVVPNNRISAPSTPSFSGGANDNNGGLTIIQNLHANGDSSIRKIAYDAVQDGLDQYDEHKLPQSMERVQKNPRMR